MSENAQSYIYVLMFLGSVALSYAANYYFQNKAVRYADELLKDIPEEYNKQIKARAYGYLVSRIIWGLFVLSSFIWNFQKIIAEGFNALTISVIFLGIFFIVWGVFGFRAEMKRLIKIQE